MKKICITPVRNEAWILDSFLKAASLWADIIIIADQNSDDNSVAIAKKYDKVHLINNKTVGFNEPERQELLLNEARKFGENNFILALDADEILSANFLYSKEWNEFFLNPRGTQMALQWANISPDYLSYSEGFPHYIFGFIDDGSLKTSTQIHSPRIPISNTKKTVYFNDVRLIHFQYAYPERFLIKHVWYQFYERIIHPQKSILDIFEQYNHFRYSKNKLFTTPEKWLYDLKNNEFDIVVVKDLNSLYWIKLIDEMINEMGIDYFKNLYIWKDTIIRSFIKFPPVKNTFYYKYIFSNILYYYGMLPNRFYKRILRNILNSILF